MTACDFTVELFVRVDDAMPEVKKHPLAKLHPSEAVTLGLLYAWRGGSFRAFDRWLRRELKTLFAHARLPERTRLHRILCACRHQTGRFLASGPAHLLWRAGQLWRVPAAPTPQWENRQRWRVPPVGAPGQKQRALDRRG